MNTDDYTQPVEAVVAQERLCASPLGASDIKALFEDWCRINPDALHEIELTALAIDSKGLRVSTKYLIERQRYEGRYKLNAVPWVDQYGGGHEWCIDNRITPCLARWLLARHPLMKVVCRKSMFDKEFEHEE